MNNVENNVSNVEKKIFCGFKGTFCGEDEVNIVPCLNLFVDDDSITGTGKLRIIRSIYSILNSNHNFVKDILMFFNSENDNLSFFHLTDTEFTTILLPFLQNLDLSFNGSEITFVTGRN